MTKKPNKMPPCETDIMSFYHCLQVRIFLCVFLLYIYHHLRVYPLAFVCSQTYKGS